MHRSSTWRSERPASGRRDSPDHGYYGVNQADRKRKPRPYKPGNARAEREEVETHHRPFANPEYVFDHGPPLPC